MGWLRSLTKFLLFLLLSAVTIPIQSLVLILNRGRAALFLPWVFQVISARLYGLKITIQGEKPLSHGLLIGNHLSYLDIIAIGQCFPVSFIAKKEVSSWPLFGLLAVLQRTVFIERKKTKSQEGALSLRDRLTQGHLLILFGEGTSTNGETVRPFKSTLLKSLFSNSAQDTLQVQTFTLILDSVNGVPPHTDAERDLYTWHGDMTLIPHLWKFGQLSGADLRIIFHAPRDIGAYSDRKALANDCYNECLTGLTQNILPPPLNHIKTSV